MSKSEIDKIKAVLNEINEASKNPFVPMQSWSIDDLAETIDCEECGSEIDLGGYTIKSNDEYRCVDIHLYGMESICKPQAKFIVLATSKITSLTKALEIAVDEMSSFIETHKRLGDNQTRQLYRSEIYESFNESLKQISEILGDK